MSNTKSYLKAKYKDYKQGVPAECLKAECLADAKEYQELRKTVSNVTGGRCPNFIPIPIFVFVVDDFLD